MFANDEFLAEFGAARGLTVEYDQTTGALVRDEIGRAVMESHPMEIVDYLQYLWDYAGIPLEPPFPEYAITGSTHFKTAVDLGAPPPPNDPWFHLIYAYMIENTRIYEIFQKVLDGFVRGETLGVPSTRSLRWLRSTEALFYRQHSAHDHFPHSTLTSDSRSDGRAIRRNTYFRMFGMDLNHGTNDNKPYPYNKPQLANREFVGLFEALLRELWVALTYPPTVTTQNPTDAGAIIDFALRLFAMLRNRRVNQTLRAEEFSAIAALDWLRLAVSFDSPIVIDLRAQAANEAERLHKMAERVALPAHGKSDDYFELAGPLSAILQGIESQTLRDPATFTALGQTLYGIITNWSSATGRIMKRMPPDRASAAA